MTMQPDVFAVELARMVELWESIASETNPVPGWESEIARIRDQQARLRATGQWRSGGRTLLHALWVHHNEVMMCRGLAWLLTPDGWHGLGTAVLDGLLVHLGVPTEGSARAVVTTEESRGDTRADVLVRFEGVAVLIEAKIWALEQRQQADRLADDFGEETPHLVFLTREGNLPSTAVTSRDRWHPITWSTIAEIVASGVSTMPDCEPGVNEYQRTLEFYGGTGRVATTRSLTSISKTGHSSRSGPSCASQPRLRSTANCLRRPCV
jgi:PD-(D/E)XK nuclease superfamily